MSERFAEKMSDPKVRKDTKTLADFTEIWCEGHHADRERAPVASDAADLGVYGSKPPVLCAECAEHLRYGEKRRAYCPKDPKPFCAHCDTHCYKPEERDFQRTMMRFSGPRSMTRGHFIDGVKHMAEARRHRAKLRREADKTAHGSD
jgi:hypothetical protein